MPSNPASTTPETAAAMRRRARIMRAVNVPMRAVLSLPFPTPLSGNLMLISYTGRKTGKAYRQPVSRARVSAVRGVNCDGVMRTLGLRGLVEEAGTEHETGAILYRTTGYFLERLGLAGLEELPELAPFLPDQIDDPEDAGDEPTSP